MDIDARLEGIFDKARSRIALSKDDCKYLLSFDERSREAALTCLMGREAMREKCGNAAVILGQIAVAVSPCPGGCKFCTFGEQHTTFSHFRIDEAQLEAGMADFCRYGDLYALYLMTMHNYDLEHYLRIVQHARKVAPPVTNIWANIGDSDYSRLCEIRDAGVAGIYHVCRLREGVDTALDPRDRIRTMENALKAGLQVFTCCEPIGPEHSVDELVDNIFIGFEVGVHQHAAMRRIAVPGSPLGGFGQISNLRLAQITAVIVLASMGVPSMSFVGVHEPCELAYMAGANLATAEVGANPRDASQNAKSRGIDMAACRRLYFESGFEYILRGDDTKIPLSFEYLVETQSL